MKRVQEAWPSPPATDLVLQAYLLGTVEFEALLHFQRYLHYEIAGERTAGALVLCEHPPTITVGRRGSRAHLDFDSDSQPWRRWPIRWVQRGGGCWLHLPGQLALYAVFPLRELGLRVGDFTQRLGNVIQRVLRDFDLHGESRPSAGGVWVGRRMVAGLGVAIRDGVSTYGACLNVEPDLEWFHELRCAPNELEPMTSLARERRGRVRPSLVRERVVDHCREAFGFGRVSLFTDHPLMQKAVERCRPNVEVRSKK